MSSDQPKKATAYKEHKKAPFLEAFSRIGTISGAAIAVGISRYAVIDWRKNDPQFKSDFEKSELNFTDRIEAIVHDEALKKNLPACFFLLRSRNPNKYTERYRHELEFPQIERIIGAFSSLIKQNVPQERWSTVSAQLAALGAQFKQGTPPPQPTLS